MIHLFLQYQSFEASGDGWAEAKKILLPSDCTPQIQKRERLPFDNAIVDLATMYSQNIPQPHLISFCSHISLNIKDAGSHFSGRTLGWPHSAWIVCFPTAIMHCPHTCCALGILERVPTCSLVLKMKHKGKQSLRSSGKRGNKHLREEEVMLVLTMMRRIACISH